MSSLIEAPLATVANVSITADPGEQKTTTAEIFTVPLGIPARLEAVYLKAVADVAFQQVAIELLLVDISGVVLYRQATPTLPGLSPALDTVLVTWARGAAGSNQLPDALPLASPTGSGLAIYTLPLPELVLQAQSTVQIVVDQESDGGLPAITLSDIAVAYTPGGQGTASTALDITPYLLPAFNG